MLNEELRPFNIQHSTFNIPRSLEFAILSGPPLRRTTLKKLALLAVLTLFVTSIFAAETTTAPANAKRYGTWGVDLEGMDRTVKPGDDFFGYVNGQWAKTTQIPPDKTAYGAFAVLGDLSEARVHALLDRWAADKSLKAG